MEQRLECTLVGLDICIAADVEGWHRQLASPRQQYVCGHVGEAAPVGEDGEPLPLEGQGVAQGLDSGKQFVGIPDAQHASPADGGIIDIVETVGRVVPTALEDQDGFVARGGTGGGEKVPGIVQLVHVDQDGAGRPVPGELIQQLAKVDVAMIAQGDEGREADFALLGPIQDGGADRCRLGEKRHLSRSRCNGGKAGVDTLPGEQHAHAVGAEQPDAVLLAQMLEPQALVSGELGGQYDGGSGSFLAELLDERQYPFAPGTDDGEIGGEGKALYVRIGEHASDGLAAGGYG